MNDESGGVTDATHRLLSDVVAHERAVEERIRRAAIFAWAVAFAAAPLAGFAMFWARNSGGTSVELARALMIVVPLVGGLGLFLAVLLTLAWLFRSRAPTLAVIERRLAVLEEILLSGGRGR